MATITTLERDIKKQKNTKESYINTLQEMEKKITQSKMIENEKQTWLNAISATEEVISTLFNRYKKPGSEL